MDINLSNVFQKRNAVSRSLSAENVGGEKGQGGMATAETSLHTGCAKCARDLGQGWKLSPCLRLPAGQAVTIMDHDGPGLIRHIWLTLDPKFYRKKSGEVGARMALYRFHVQDPVFFQSDLRVTMQAIGWRSEGRYLPLQDDISSVVYWYQAEPHASFPELPDRDAREII
jgi:hypothetical protein